MITKTLVKVFPVHWHCGCYVATFFSVMFCPCIFIPPFMTVMSIRRGHKYTSPSYERNSFRRNLLLCVLSVFSGHFVADFLDSVIHVRRVRETGAFTEPRSPSEARN